MKSVQSPSNRSFMIAYAALTVSMVMLMGDAALAQVASDFGGVQTKVGDEIAKVPRLFAVVSYVVGAFFAADGLLKMKAWLEDSDKNPLNAVIFRLAVSALLIYLPYGIIMVNTTIFGSDASHGSQIPQTKPPKLKVF